MPSHETQNLSAKIDALSVSCTRIETKLDNALTVQHDHEERIRTTEKWKWLHLGTSSPGILHAFISFFGGK